MPAPKLRLEISQLVLDIAGIVDPTPTADLLGAALAVYRGQFWDALASVAGAALPYAGDAAKVLRLPTKLRRITDALKTIDSAELDQLRPLLVQLGGALQGLAGKLDGAVAGLSGRPRRLLADVKETVDESLVAINQTLRNGAIIPPSRQLPAPRSRAYMRNQPGTARAFQLDRLPLVNGKNWLRGSHGNAGRFPRQIAMKMRNRSFQSFTEFRQAFWREVAADDDLWQAFVKVNPKRNDDAFRKVVRSEGVAPYTAELSLGPRGGERYSKYVLHHQRPIRVSGETYDMDNLLIVAPRYHQDILDRSFHFGNELPESYVPLSWHNIRRPD